jgi:hypothetical protein
LENTAVASLGVAVLVLGSNAACDATARGRSGDAAGARLYTAGAYAGAGGPIEPIRLHAVGGAALGVAWLLVHERAASDATTSGLCEDRAGAGPGRVSEGAGRLAGCSALAPHSPIAELAVTRAAMVVASTLQSVWAAVATVSSGSGHNNRTILGAATTAGLVTCGP